MIRALLEGFLLGLTLSLLIGPVFFALLDIAIRKGFREGAKMALGINMSDWFFAGLAILGIGSIQHQIESSYWLAYIGGALLIILGLNGIRSKPVLNEFEIQDRLSSPKGGRKRFSSLGKGFLLNTFNPGTPFIWLAASTSSTSIYKENGLWFQVFFMITILVTVLATDLAKIYICRRFSNLFNPIRLSLINKAIGIVMIFGGIYYIYLGYNKTKNPPETKPINLAVIIGLK